MKFGSPMFNSTGSIGLECSSDGPVAVPLPPFGGEARPSLSSGSNESTWGSSVMVLSLFSACPLGPNVGQSLPVDDRELPSHYPRHRPVPRRLLLCRRRRRCEAAAPL